MVPLKIGMCYTGRSLEPLQLCADSNIAGELLCHLRFLMSDSSNGGPSKSRSKSPPRLKDEDSNIRRQRASESGIVRHPEHPSFRWVGQADAIIEPVDILMYKQDAKRGTLSEFTSLERNGETMEFAWQVSSVHACRCLARQPE